MVYKEQMINTGLAWCIDVSAYKMCSGLGHNSDIFKPNYIRFNSAILICIYGRKLMNIELKTASSRITYQGGNVS